MTTVTLPRRSVTRTAVVASALGLALSVGCRTPATVPVVPVVDHVATAWTAAYDDARVSIASGRFAHADSVLTAFRDRYVGMPQSADALYWRAIARTGLVTTAGGARAVLADLEAYRATGTPDHLAEVTALGRGLAQLDSARTAPVAPTDRVTVSPRAALVSRDTLRARDEELARARAEVLAMRVELDRVRRRLAAPGRPP